MLAPPTERPDENLRRARQLALLIPAALLGGALLSQYVGGLYPCEMCLWQRWPHRFAILFAIAAILLPSVVPRIRLLTLLAAGPVPAGAPRAASSRSVGDAGVSCGAGCGALMR